MTETKSHAWRLAAAVGWTILILILVTIPDPDLPDADLPQLDKIAHFALFAGFGWLWMRSLPIKLDRRFKLILFAGLAYAVLTELYQGILPYGRQPDVLDAAANLAGLLSGAGFSRYRLKQGEPGGQAARRSNSRNPSREDEVSRTRFH